MKNRSTGLRRQKKIIRGSRKKFSLKWDTRSGSPSSVQDIRMPSPGGEGPGIFEVVEDHRGDTYRAVYTVRFAGVVYVLHAFQKKSKSGIKTPQEDVKLISERLKRAQQDYQCREHHDYPRQ